MQLDSVSSILSFINVRSACGGGLSGGGAWALKFPPPDKIEFFAVVEGSCELVLHGGAEAMRFDAGDVFLLSAQQPYIIRSSNKVPVIDVVELHAKLGTDLIPVGEGEGFLALVGHIHLDDTAAGLLVDGLSPVIRVSRESAEAAKLQWLIDEYVREFRSAEPGSYFACAGIAQLLFVRILRGYLETGSKVPGWLRAVTDPRLSEPLRLMHSDPGRNWSLVELARAAGMSRTTFAVYFKTVAGVAPVTYLTEWRMRIAERCLRGQAQSIASVARSLGYGSDAAFSNAFKRVIGKSPSHYRAGFVSGVRQEADALAV